MQAVLTLAALVAVVVFVGCEGDQGPPGIAGTQNCTESCHTDSYDMDHYIRAKQAEYAASQHARAETVVRRSSDCARCHTTEGFQHFVATGMAEEVLASSPIGCFACHAPHTNENFAVRVTSAVDLMVGGTYDKLESNTCATCHQSRLPSPAIEDLATAITSSRWGPHNGPQANLLSGEGAWEFSGTFTTNHGHNSITNGCVGCHMAESASNGFAGGHTFSIDFVYHGEELVNSNGCTCHGDWSNEDATERVEERQSEFEEGLTALSDALIALGWLKSATSVDGSNIPANVDARGAVFNYQLLIKDKSMGVHNPAYADDILEATRLYVDQQVKIAGL